MLQPIEILAAIIFVFYANRWMYGLNRPRQIEEIERDTFPGAVAETELAAETMPEE